jgi:hypothetical protein
MLAYEHAQLTENLLMTSEGKVAIEPIHQRSDAQLVEPRHLVASERLELQPGQRRAAPERERLAEDLRGGVEFARGDMLTRSC